MNDYEAQIAQQVRDAVNAWSTTTERAEQDKQFIIGPSAIGFCSERLRRQLDHQDPKDEVEWNKAFIGTAVGDYLERAWKKAKPHILIQSEFEITLEGDRYTYRIPAHADVIDPVEKALWDFKAKNGLMYVARQATADQGYQFQRHLYALGAYQQSLIKVDDPTEITVGNIYYDRSGIEPVPHVQAEPFSWDVIREATWWLEEVVEAFLAGEEAQKEPPREMCERTCGFFTACRAYDTDVEGRIEDPDALGAIEMYVEANALESRAKKMKNEAKIMLKGIEGHTPTHTLRWTLVNGSSYTVNRESYLKLDLRKRRT